MDTYSGVYRFPRDINTASSPRAPLPYWDLTDHPRFTSVLTGVFSLRSSPFCVSLSTSTMKCDDRDFPLPRSSVLHRDLDPFPSFVPEGLSELSPVPGRLSR